MTPIWIVVKTNGQIWATSSIDAAEAMTGVAATYRINSLVGTQQIGTLSGTGPYAASGNTGHSGKELI